MSKGRLWIIPNEEKILQSEFCRKINNGGEYVVAMQEFSNKYMLDLIFNVDEEKNAPYAIADLGHMLIKTDDNLNIATLYLPKVITDRQEDWLIKDMDEIDSYVKKDIYTKNNDEWEKLSGVNDIRKEMIKKKNNSIR